MAAMTQTLQQMYRYRHLLISLLTRAFVRKYYRTRFGILWLILQPIVTTLMYTVVFSVIVRVPADSIPYPIFFLVGYIPWVYFSNVFMTNSRAITSNTNFIEHYRFPHILLICVPLLTELVEVVVGCIVLIVLMLVLSVPFASTFWLIFPLLMLEVILMAGLSLWLAPLVARLKDIDLLLQPFVRFFFHAIPVIYPVTAVPENAQNFYLLNPFSGLIDTMRAVMFDTTPMRVNAAMWLIFCAFGALFTGFFFFQSQVKHFADLS